MFLRPAFFLQPLCKFFPLVFRSRHSRPSSRPSRQRFRRLRTRRISPPSPPMAEPSNHPPAFAVRPGPLCRRGELSPSFFFCITALLRPMRLPPFPREQTRPLFPGNFGFPPPLIGPRSPSPMPLSSPSFFCDEFLSELCDRSLPFAALRGMVTPRPTFSVESFGPPRSGPTPFLVGPPPLGSFSPALGAFPLFFDEALSYFLPTRCRPPRAFCPGASASFDFSAENFSPLKLRTALVVFPFQYSLFSYFLRGMVPGPFTEGLSFHPFFPP